MKNATPRKFKMHQQSITPELVHSLPQLEVLVDKHFAALPAKQLSLPLGIDYAPAVAVTAWRHRQTKNGRPGYWPRFAPT